jgi:hypothetical protein
MNIVPALVAAAVLCSAPAFAQDHADHQPAPAPAPATEMSKMTPEEMHKHCSAKMDAKADAAPKHEHPAAKAEHAPAAKAPADAKMKAMHKACAARMAARAKDADKH